MNNKISHSQYMIVVSAASACGKTTLVNHLETNFNFKRLKTCTTRARREGETDADYNFMDISDYQKNLYANKFIEHGEVYGNYYGILRTEIESSADRDIIVTLDVKGRENFIKEYPHAISIFFLPPSMEEIETRLKERKTTATDVKLRLKEARIEIKASSKYDYTVPYGTLDEMKISLENIIKSI